MTASPLLEMKPERVLKYHLFVNYLLGVGKRDAFALQGIVKLFRTGEESGRALDHAPAGLDADRIHHQRQRGQDFCDAAAIEGRADVHNMLRANTISLPQYPFCHRSADQRL